MCPYELFALNRIVLEWLVAGTIVYRSDGLEDVGYGQRILVNVHILNACEELISVVADLFVAALGAALLDRVSVVLARAARVSRLLSSRESIIES
jgi:hypothetical protein